MSNEDEVPDLVKATPSTNAGAQNEPVDLDGIKVPLTVFTGYLGSGKSTLLNWVSTQTEKKIAIIVNEFGDSADIERSISISDGEKQYEEWLELDNGCLCCTVKDNGVSAIENLMKKKGKFDYILLETTGVADPGPIANMFWLDEALAANIYLDGIVTMLDAANIIKSLDDTTTDNEHASESTSNSKPLSTAAIQIAYSDVLLLNKTDLAGASLSEIKTRVRGINGIAPIIECQYGKVDLDRILDLHAYEGRIPEGLDGVEEHGWHDHRVCTIAFSFFTKQTGDIEKFEAWIQHVLWENTVGGSEVEIHRSKGIIFNPDGSFGVLQGVRQTYEIVDKNKDDAAQMGLDPKKSKIVLIGKGLEKSSVIADFEKKTGLSVYS